MTAGRSNLSLEATLQPGMSDLAIQHHSLYLGQPDKRCLAMGVPPSPRMAVMEYQWLRTHTILYYNWKAAKFNTYDDWPSPQNIHAPNEAMYGNGSPRTKIFTCFLCRAPNSLVGMPPCLPDVPRQIRSRSNTPPIIYAAPAAPSTPFETFTAQMLLKWTSKRSKLPHWGQ